MCRTADRLRRASYLRPSHPGELVDLACIRTRARVARENWSIPRVLGPGRDSSGTAGRNRGPSDPSTSRLGELVTPWTLPPERESLGRARQHRRPSDPGTSLPGRLVNTERSQTHACVARESWSTPQALESGPRSPRTSGQACGTSDMGRVCQDSWSTPRTLGNGPESPRRSGRPRGPSDPGPNRPGHLVETPGPRRRD